MLLPILAVLPSLGLHYSAAQQRESMLRSIATQTTQTTQGTQAMQTTQTTQTTQTFF